MQSYTDYGYLSAQPSWDHSILMPHLLAMLRGTQGPVLDLGCGNGVIARELMSHGYDVYGVDGAASGIALANGQAAGRFHVMNFSSGQLPEPLAGMLFGAVISTEVVEHLYDPRSLVKLARRILPPGGSFILSTPYHGYLKNLAMALTGKLDAHFTVLWDGGHIKFFSRNTLEAMLREQQFEVVQFAGAGRLPYLWKSMLVKATVA